jgi:hypothetical protein
MFKSYTNTDEQGEKVVPNINVKWEDIIAVKSTSEGFFAYQLGEGANMKIAVIRCALEKKTDTNPVCVNVHERDDLKDYSLLDIHYESGRLFIVVLDTKEQKTYIGRYDSKFKPISDESKFGKLGLILIAENPGSVNLRIFSDDLYVIFASSIKDRTVSHLWEIKLINIQMQNNIVSSTNSYFLDQQKNGVYDFSNSGVVFASG